MERQPRIHDAYAIAAAADCSRFTPAANPCRLVGLISVACLCLTASKAATHADDDRTQRTPAPATRGPADDTTADNDRLQREKIEFYLERIRSQRLSWAGAPEQAFELVPEPLMTFDNPVSRIRDGFLFVWTQGGRPVAAMKCYYNEPQASWGRTFVSLGEKRLEMTIENAKTWTPQDAGATFSVLPDAPPPAGQPQLRLAQMRSLAERFEVVDHWGKEEPTDWNLRLLRTPLYRYSAEGEGIRDGALFGYVLTTSPEALLLLEARDTEDGPRWHYAVSRMTVFGLTVSLAGQPVADFPRLRTWPATGTYFHLAVPMTDYPFAEIER